MKPRLRLGSEGASRPRYQIWVGLYQISLYVCVHAGVFEGRPAPTELMTPMKMMIPTSIQYCTVCR